MTEQSEDTTSVSTAEPTNAAKDTAIPKKQSFLGIAVAGILILLLAGFGTGYYTWQKIQTTLNANQQVITRLNQEIQALQSDSRMHEFSSQMEEKFKRNQQQLDAISQQQQALQQAQTITAAKANLTHDMVMADEHDWLLLEASHLLRMAQHRLILARDFGSAIAALHSADQRLKEIDASGLIPIRNSINQQIHALEKFPHPDYVALQLELDNLSADLRSGLTDSSDANAMPEPDQSVDDNPDTSMEDELVIATREFLLNMLEYVKSVFNESVQVTHGEQQASVFIEQQEQKRAYDFISLKILATKYAITNRDDEIYQQQLDAALLWLENNDGFANKAKLITAIKQLKDIQLQPSLPDISPPEELLADYIARNGASK